MNRGRGRSLRGRFSNPIGRGFGRSSNSRYTSQFPVEVNHSSPVIRNGSEDHECKAFQNLPGSSSSRQNLWKPKLNNPSQHEQASPLIDDISSHIEKLVLDRNIARPKCFNSSQPEVLHSHDTENDTDFCSRNDTHLNEQSESNIGYKQHESLLAMNSDSDIKYTTPNEMPKCEDQIPSGSTENSEISTVLGPFDICPGKSRALVMLKAPLFTKNRERRLEKLRSIDCERVLRPGMVILKNYFSSADQVKILKRCRELGIGSGGFYQPGYRDGAKLQLKMMCLGKNWDPESGKYGFERPIDGAKPPNIPLDFCKYVKEAIQRAHALIKKDPKVECVEDFLPSMEPNLCIVNFYTTSGRLGLHQDKDESSESIKKGLPVVSFSIGDSANFEYGDEPDGKTDKVVLESGDVLIFGGKSRLVFHGVSAICPKTAPEALTEESHLRPGRLNLTFRKY